MNLKEQCKPTVEGYYTLDTGNGVPTRIFLTEKLYNESEPGLYNQIAAATSFPGVREVAKAPK